MAFNRTITTFRAPFLGVAPAERARRAQRHLLDLLEHQGPLEVSVRREPQGNVLMVGGELAFGLVPEDVDPVTSETLEQATEAARAVLSRVVAETREARDRNVLLRAFTRSGAVTLAFLLAVASIWIARRWLVSRLAKLLSEHTEGVQVAGAKLLDRGGLVRLSRWLVRAIAGILLLGLSYRWVSFVLVQFPYSRPWGEEADGFLIGIAQRIGGGVLSAIPDLMVALVIFLLARALIGAFRPFFDGVEHGRLDLGWLDGDTARATRRFFSAGVWLFAIVMAYPYLPGSSSEAFKGVSVLVGLMVTLGGSSLFGQAASGLILMYSRTLRPGEYVRVADQEGTVSELGTFTTKLRTGLGEEVTVPNAVVLATVTKNYSRPHHGGGYVMDTVVTIGYDAPWRQVVAMLIEAARRTDGVISDPAPVVFQTALADYYVEYRLVCQAVFTTPRPRALALSALHGNVQDVFNEYGVQIMSPHYRRDPDAPKVVPKSQWYAAPAVAPAEPASDEDAPA